MIFADDWIASQILNNNIVITGDILLAERCLKLKAHVLGYKGIEFTDENIGNALATRELMQNLRYFEQIMGTLAHWTKRTSHSF